MTCARLICALRFSYSKETIRFDCGAAELILAARRSSFNPISRWLGNGERHAGDGSYMSNRGGSTCSAVENRPLDMRNHAAKITCSITPWVAEPRDDHWKHSERGII